MNYLSQFRAANPDLQGFSDDQIVEALPQLLPERFGGKPMSQVRAEALLAPEELEVRQYRQQGGGIGSSVERGLLRVNQTFNAAGAALGDAVMGAMPDSVRQSDIGQWLQGQADQDKLDIVRDQERMGELPQRPEMLRAIEAANNAETGMSAVGAFAKEVWDSPDTAGFLVDTMAEQIPVMATMALGTKGAGGMFGTSSALGRAATFGTGAGIGSGSTTFGSDVAEAMGQDISKFDEATDYAFKRSLAQAIVDGTVGAVVPFKIGGNQIVNIPTQAVLQAAGGAAGEYAGGAAVGEEVSKGELVAEGLLELLSLPADLAMANIEYFNSKRNPVGDANTRINAAGDQIAATGGDALAQESAEAQAASSEIPGAVGEAKTVADTLKAAGQVSAADLGIQMPEQRDWSQYDSAPTGREAAQPVTRQEEQTAPRQSARDMSGLDGLIITADRMGFADEAAMLRTSQRLYKQAEDARTGSDADRYFSLIDRADRLYREATETNDQVREIADQFPVPYVAQGEVTGGEVGPYQGPGRTGEIFDQPRSVGGPAALEQQRTNRLTDSGIIFGEEPDYARAQRQQMESERAQRTADDFSARYGQEGQTPLRPAVIEGELDRSGELPPAQRQAALPPGTGQINMGQDRPQQGIQQPQTGYEGIGRNTVERTAQAKTNALPAGNATRAITPDQYRNVMDRARLALRTPVSRRTPEMTQALEVREQVRAGQIEVAETQPAQAAPAPELRMRANGSPFATERAAQASAAFRDNREYASVVPVDGGFAVQIDAQTRDQAETQAAESAQAKSDQAKRRMFREPDTVNDDMLDAIALMGGIDRAEAESEGIDPANFGRQAGGIRYVFPRQNGDSFDGMAERLAQYGYLDPRVDRLDDLRDKLDQAINGNAKIMTPEGYEALAEKEAAAEAQLQQEHEPTIEGATQDEEWLIEAYAMAQGSGVPTQVIDTILNQYQGDATLMLVELNDAIEQARTATGSTGRNQEGRRTTPAEAFGASEPLTPEAAAEIWGSVDSEPLLSSYTESDLQAQADARTAAEEADARTQREAEQKAQADAEVNDFSLTGSNRPADVAAAAGQNDMFGLGGTPRAEQPAAQQTEPTTPTTTEARPETEVTESDQAEAAQPEADNTQEASGSITANGITIEVPAIDQQLVDDYNRATHMGRGRDLNAELRSEAEGLLNELAERKYTLDTPEQKAEAKRLIEAYLQAQAEFSQWDARYSASNPSWIVTGRSGRNMDKSNRANERHMDEYTKRVDRLQAQRDRIGDTLYKMRPQEVQENQALTADLRNITQQAGHILGYLEEGKNALVAETRKWASPKAHKLIERSLKANPERTIEHIRELENTKAVQDAGGLAKVFGPRSKAGKLAQELLAEKSPSFSRAVDDDAARSELVDSATTGTAIPLEDVKRIAGRIVGSWKNAPDWSAVATDFDLPADLQKSIDERNARGQIDGIFHKGRFYLIADKIRTEADVERIVLHEALGHYGLRQLYGPAFGMHMDRLFNRVGGYPGIQRLGKKYGFDLSSYWENAGDMSLAERREMMADELIAHIAGTGTVQPDLIQQIAHLIRKGLRKIMAGTRFAERLDQMTDVEVLRIVAAARNAVVEGEARATTLTHDPRFVRMFDEAMYGDSLQASNTEAAGMEGFDTKTVYYHGTDADFERFDSSFLGENFGDESSTLGHFFTTNRDGAELYGQNIKEVYLKTENPLVIDAEEIIREEYDYLVRRGEFDGDMDTFIEEYLEDDPYGYYETGSLNADLKQAAAEGRDSLVVDFGKIKSEKRGGKFVVVFSPDQIMNVDDAAESGGDSAPMFSRSGDAAPGTFAAPEENHLKVALRKMADKFQVLKDLQKNIQDAGGTVNEGNDAYLAEELFHGKTEEDLRQMRETFIKPLADKMAKFGIEQADLDQYLYAKHAPERNAHIAEINPELQEAGSGMSDAKAAEIIQQVRESRKLEQYEQLAGMVYDMLETRRETMRSAGLEEDGMIDAWENKYEFYVPLKGWAADEQQDNMARTGSGFNIAGKESKRAMGRSSEAASPSSYAIQDLTETLIRRRKNEVGNALLKLAEDNPNKAYWQVFTNDNPDIDRQIFRSETEASKQARKEAKKAGQPEPDRQYQETVRETPIPMAMMPDKYFQTKRNGKAYFIKLEDERLMKAMKNIGPDTSNFLIRKLGAVNRVLSSLNTSYNPEFVVGNFARDVQTAVLNLMAEQSRDDGKAMGEKIAKQTVKDIPKAMRAVYRGLRNKDEAAGGEWQKWFTEFREAGAKTGWFDMKDIDGQAADLQTLISMSKGGVKGNAMKWFKATGQMVEDLNGSVENAVRLSAYVNARKAGISQAKAASLAKNMTVNFNRRGEVGTTLNALYMFANASIQGSMNFARTMIGLKGQKGDPIWQRLNTAQKVAAGLVMGSYAIAMANRFGAGEDDDGENWYDKVPDYVKERNLVIMKSLLGGEQDGSYWTIPLPYGYNIFHVFGNALEGTTNGNTSIGEAATDLTLAALGSFSPIGFQESQSLTGTAVRNVTPTLGKPLVDIGFNENFMGTSIYNENFPFGTPKPESQLGRRSTPEGYKAIAEFLNDVSGGSQWRSGYIDINPDVMRYVANYFTGAAGKFVFDKAPNNLYHLATLTPIEARETLFISRVSGRVLPYSDREKFYTRRDEIGQAEAEWKGLTGGDRVRFYRENRQLLSLKPLIQSTEKQLKALRQQRDRIYAMDLPRKDQEARLEAIDARMKRIIDRFNRRYNQATSAD